MFVSRVWFFVGFLNTPIRPPTHPPTRTLPPTNLHTHLPTYIYVSHLPTHPYKHGGPRWCADAHDAYTVMCMWHVYVHSSVYVLCVYVEPHLNWMKQGSVTIHMYVYIYIHVYIYTYIHKYTYMYIHICKNKYIWVIYMCMRHGSIT